MQYIITIAVIFLIMFTAPFVTALIYCSVRKGDVLPIQQSKMKDARYFGKSFARKVDEGLENVREDIIVLSTQEVFIDEDRKALPDGNIDRVVISREGELVSDVNDRIFNKEVYSAEKLRITGENVKLRAAYAGDSMVLGNGISVERWVDAENTLAVYDDCKLGVSASAGKRLSVGCGCTFQRLYAPEILIGQYPDSVIDAMAGKVSHAFDCAEKLEVVRDIGTVDEDMVNERKEADITILSVRDVTVLEDIIIRGDISSEKSIRLCDNSVVCGNVFAEKDIRIGKNVVVLGNIFTQGDVYVEENATLGRAGRIISMIARGKIAFEKNVSVFGYVSCENGGSIVSTQTDKKTGKYQYLDRKRDVLTHLRVESLDEYQKIDEQGYRLDEHLQTVEITADVDVVPKSLFFGCSALEKVTLPFTLQNIGPYAFADCNKLTQITDFSRMQLTEIGTSAFENCESLEVISFPPCLEKLENAAFGGCSNLKTVVFPENAKLKSVGCHCFRGCENLKQIKLPDTVEHVGLSAFAGCTSLRSISVPKACENELGITELQEKENLQIIIREEA